jgi:pimeloyl-ACP methyl ester carboxylesterase
LYNSSVVSDHNIMVNALSVHIGVAQWRERWITRRNKRCKGVWDGMLLRETLVLNDGRLFTYFLDGPLVRRDAVPYIFVFHAMFLSGNSFLMTDPPEDYILVCVNRPGYFGSDPANDEYTYQTFAHDIAQLADHLSVDKFVVVGHSSGGPCALACAAHLGPNRVCSVGILSGDPEYALASAPDKHWYNACLVGSFLPCLLERVLPCLPLARGASKGLRTDYRLETSLYTFRTEDITQPVLIFVGEDDNVLPPALSLHVHSRLENAQLEIVPKAGHLCLLKDQILLKFFSLLLNVTTEQGEDAMTEDTIEQTSDATDVKFRGHPLQII